MAKIKVALLGSFPVYPYRNRIKFWNPKKNLVTSWNVNLAKHLALNKELDVHFYCNAPLFKTKVLKEEDLTIHFLGHPPRLDILNRITFLRFSKYQIILALKKLNPDIVHGIGTDHEYAYIAATSNFRHVITIHGVMKQIVKKYNSPWYSSFRMFAKFEPKAVQNTKHIISINPYVSEQFNDFKGTFHQIENPIHIDFFSQQTCEEFDLCFIGMYNKGKRLLNLIKAVDQLKLNHPDISLAVVGSSRDKNYDNTIQDYVKNKKISNYVKFFGQLEQKEVAKIIAKTKILVVPSIQETAPMVIAEAMALGKPVVATNVGGIKYMLRDKETGFLIPPDNISKIVEKTDLLLKDKNLRLKMGEKAKEIALNTFHPDSVAKKTYLVYKQILEEKR